MIHSTAIIHETSKIAQNVEIGAYTVIGPNVVIEEGCKIAESANIQYAHIGKNTKIAPFASICNTPGIIGLFGKCP